MSHVAKVDLEFTDLAALSVAARKLGGEYLPEEARWRWYGRWMNDYAAKDAAYKSGIPASRYGHADAGILRFPGCGYDVGIYQDPKKPGVFIPVYDFYANGKGLVPLLGRNLETLKAYYGCEVARRTLARKGFKVTQTKDKHGRPKLVAVK